MSAEIDVDSLVFVAERALNTGDTQDHVFIDDSADGKCFGLYRNRQCRRGNTSAKP